MTPFIRDFCGKQENKGKGEVMNRPTIIVVIFVCFVVTSPILAGTWRDDFEDGNLNGWEGVDQFWVVENGECSAEFNAPLGTMVEFEQRQKTFNNFMKLSFLLVFKVKIMAKVEELEEKNKDQIVESKARDLAKMGLIRLATGGKVEINLPPKFPGKPLSEYLKEIRE